MKSVIAGIVGALVIAVVAAVALTTIDHSSQSRFAVSSTTRL